MKICDLTQFYSPLSGGVKRYVQEKIAYLQEARPGDEHVLIVPDARTETTTEGRSRIYRIHSPLISRTSRYRALLNLQAVERVFERERPDVIEVGDPYQTAWKAIASGRALRIPVIGFYHSHFPEAYLRRIARFFGRTATEFAMDHARRYVVRLYNHFAATLVPAEPLARLLTQWGVRNVREVDLGVNTRLFKPGPDDAETTRARLAVPPDRLLLLYVGRLAPEKNFQTLLEAFDLLAERSPGRFHLLVVGEGAQRDRLRRRLAAGAAITWVPYSRDSAELAQFYRAADLFVHPGIQETFGLVTLESQACGTPVVGIRGSYMDRIILHEQEAWASANTPADLAEAVARIAEQDLPALGRAAADRVGHRYAWPVVFERLFSVYREVCGR